MDGVEYIWPLYSLVCGAKDTVLYKGVHAVKPTHPRVTGWVLCPGSSCPMCARGSVTRLVRVYELHTDEGIRYWVQSGTQVPDSGSYPEQPGYYQVLRLAPRKWIWELLRPL